jgi:hypothetical protein
MLMRVRENGDRILIELTGIAGRQQSVLRALSECRDGHGDDGGMATAEVLVRANANDMRISVRAKPGLHVEPMQIYRCLRDALFATDRTGALRVAAAAVAGTAAAVAG